jgi:hypothetical protein
MNNNNTNSFIVPIEQTNHSRQLRSFKDISIQPTKKIRIKIFSSFCDTKECKRNFENIWVTNKMENYGEDKPLYITTGDDYTHVIILNTAMPEIPSNIPKQNVIGLAYEPIPFLNLSPAFVKYANRYINKYYIGDISGVLIENKELSTPPFIEKYSYMWHIKPPIHLPVKDMKINFMSIMVSQKRYAPGHSYRHDLVKKILDSNLPIDVFGRGCLFYGSFDKRVKGSFVNEEPYEKYTFHICIENFQSQHYFSEKIINPLLYDTVPVYLGCKNIDDYFPDNVIKLTGNINNDFEIITDIISYPRKYLKYINKEKIKKDMNLLQQIDKLF